MASIALQDCNLQIVRLNMDLIRISRKKKKFTMRTLLIIYNNYKYNFKTLHFD